MASLGTAATSPQPHWWSEQHTSTWERIKAAFQRDWEQTKSDLTAKKSGHALNQNAADTVKQAAGTEPIPPASSPVPAAWKTSEAALRFGFGAHHHYATSSHAWEADLETKLRKDWDELHTGSDWDRVKPDVQHGWEEAHRHH